MMNVLRFNLLIFVFTFLSATVYSQASKKEAIQKSQELSVKELYAHMQFLAHDTLEGRNIASKGYNYAAEYMADNLKKYNIQPGGEKDSYYQKVPLNEIQLNPSRNRIPTSKR